MQKIIKKYFFVILILLVTSWEIFFKKINYLESKYGVQSYKNWTWSSVINEKFSKIKDIFFLSNKIKKLQEENSNLHKIILNKRIEIEKLEKNLNYDIFAAKVVGNTINLSRNYIILNKGSSSGINKGMGVFTSHSPVGIVVDTSENFSLVASILNRDFWISAKVKNSGFVGSINWKTSLNPKMVSFIISKHAEVKIGDEVVTSGYSQAFPPDLKIGKIKSIKSRGDQPNYEVDVELNENIGSLNYVYVVEYKKQSEKLDIAKKGFIEEKQI